ncbi:MAG TPA: RluA family pseudouridine synthase [Acidimicrobiales bacterium]|nr:RluA family pseudouridine synthase [Acidimicrobiales bacterium]
MIETRRDIVPSALDDERVDRVVAMLTEASRARVKTLIDGAHVRIGGVVVTKSAQRVRAGDEIVVEFEEEVPVRADSTIELTIVHEDEDVVVIDKPPGLVVHPGAGHRDDTLVSALLARYPEIVSAGDPQRPGIVHRLDKGTSGLLMVARSPRAYESLVAQLADRTVVRSYTALVCRSFEEHEGVVDAPIGRSSRAPTRMAVTPRGRDARTRYVVEQRFVEPVPASLLSCRLESGRTHQIRVHLSAIGAPVLGDDRYGGRRVQVPMRRPFLHAARLGFVHPVSGEDLAFVSPLPPDLVSVLAAFS